MKIKLGTVSSQSGPVLDAWIEPVQPQYYEALGRVSDSGVLRLRSIEPVADIDGQSRYYPIDIELSTSSEDRRRAVSELGVETGRALFAELQRYTQEPFFAKYQHPKLGALYASSTHGSNTTSIALTSRTHDSKYDERTEFSTVEDLAFFIAAGRMAALPSWMPSQEDTKTAIAHGNTVAAGIASAKANFDAVVTIQGPGPAAAAADDSARYESISTGAVRPSRSAFVSDTPEFYRWYEWGGKGRPEPLTFEQLEELYPQEDVRSLSDAISAEDWEWFKSQKLGRTREAVDIIQKAIASQPAARWLDPISAEIDWCSSKSQPIPEKLFSLISDVQFRLETQPSHDLASSRLSTALTEARTSLLTSYPDLAQTSSTEGIQEAHANLLILHQSFSENHINGNSEHARYDIELANELSNRWPVLEGLLDFNEPAHPKHTSRDNRREISSDTGMDIN